MKAVLCYVLVYQYLSKLCNIVNCVSICVKCQTNQNVEGNINSKHMCKHRFKNVNLLSHEKNGEKNIQIVASIYTCCQITHHETYPILIDGAWPGRNLTNLTKFWN